MRQKDPVMHNEGTIVPLYATIGHLTANTILLKNEKLQQTIK